MVQYYRRKVGHGLCPTLFYYKENYNDVLPPDTDRVKDGMDKELIKKIVALGIGVTVIILMCVALLYVL